MSIFFIPKSFNACWINNKSNNNILTLSKCGMRTMEKINRCCLKMLQARIYCLFPPLTLLHPLIVHCVCVCVCTWLCPNLQPHGLQPSRLLCAWDFSGKNTGVGCHFPPQEIFLTQGSNPHLLHWQVDSLLLSHQGAQC